MNCRALSLLEVLFALSITTMLVVVLAFANLTTLKGWYQISSRNDALTDLDACFGKISNELRRGKAVSVSSHSIRYGVNESGADNYYIYYLYNSSDVWPPNYNQTTYDLKKTSLSSGINGTFAYGSGELICPSLNPPSSPSCSSQNTCFSLGTKAVSINLAQTDKAEVVSIKNVLRLRNA